MHGGVKKIFLGGCYGGNGGVLKTFVPPDARGPSYATGFSHAYRPLQFPADNSMLSSWHGSSASAASVGADHTPIS